MICVIIHFLSVMFSSLLVEYWNLFTHFLLQGDYVFIHEVLADYVESFDPYANFKN